jgi:hypothetical protein
MLAWTLTWLVDMGVGVADDVDAESPCFHGPNIFGLLI